MKLQIFVPYKECSADKIATVMTSNLRTNISALYTRRRIDMSRDKSPHSYSLAWHDLRRQKWLPRNIQQWAHSSWTDGLRPLPDLSPWTEIPKEKERNNGKWMASSWSINYPASHDLKSTFNHTLFLLTFKPLSSPDKILSGTIECPLPFLEERLKFNGSVCLMGNVRTSFSSKIACLTLQALKHNASNW